MAKYKLDYGTLAQRIKKARQINLRISYMKENGTPRCAQPSTPLLTARSKPLPAR